MTRLIVAAACGFVAGYVTRLHHLAYRARQWRRRNPERWARFLEALRRAGGHP